MTSRLIALSAGLLIASACGGSDNGPTPSPAPAMIVTITSSGVSPKTVTVPRGSQVQFTNNDGAAHDMASNPHPEHTDCTEINSVGFLNPGQSRQTGNMNTARTCGFHDHSNPNNTNLQGSIVVQ